MSTGEWNGKDSDDCEWRVEVEPDCFNLDDGLVVSLWVRDGNEDIATEALAGLTPTEAREVAAVLLACADHVEVSRVVGRTDTNEGNTDG